MLVQDGGTLVLRWTEEKKDLLRNWKEDNDRMDKLVLKQKRGPGRAGLGTSYSFRELESDCWILGIPGIERLSLFQQWSLA